MTGLGGWRRAVQLRCGECDEPFRAGDRTVDVDDERCHVSCSEYADLEPISCACVRDQFGNVDPCTACELRAEETDYLSDLCDPERDDRRAA